MSLHLSSGKRDLVIDPPWLNAAGFLSLSSVGTVERISPLLGAVVTSPVSLAPRSPARPPRLLDFPGGFLLHTGWPNPGLNAMLRRERRAWRSLACPIIVHLLPASGADLERMLDRLEGVEEVDAIELALGEIELQEAVRWTERVRRSQFPLIAQFPPGTEAERLRPAVQAGAAAISLGPPRGTLPSEDGILVRGRLYGPAMLAGALRTIEAWANSVEVPLMGAGGVYSAAAGTALLSAGASAVQLDGILWTQPEVLLGTTPG
jgi:dihydroorotate dehydrogenase (NAD+) catalytic subunit